MNIRYGKAFKLPRKIAKYFFSLIYPLVIKLWKLPNVKSIDETIDAIVKFEASICRYGDSEFLYIIDELDLPYQKFIPELKTRMIEILQSNNEKILVGLPVGYYSLFNLNKESRRVWRSQISWIYPRLFKYLKKDKIYFNSSMTRVYIDYLNKDHCIRWFEKLKSIWYDKNLVIVEGEKSRLGVGNDLFNGAKSVERILAPAHQAYSKYSELLNYCKTLEKSKLILIALGPTATVLAYDLALEGFQALDIGNIDIEYEWFLRGVKKKIKIPNKYTSEAIGGRVVGESDDVGYNSQIIAKIL